MAGHICNPGTGEPKAGGESKIEVSLDYQVKLSLPKHKPKQNQHSSSLKSFLGSQNFNTHWPQDQVGGCYILVTAEIRVELFRPQHPLASPHLAESSVPTTPRACIVLPALALSVGSHKSLLHVIPHIPQGRMVFGFYLFI